MSTERSAPSGPPPDFRAWFEAAPGLALVLAPDLRIVAASQAYLQAMQARREDLVGRPVAQALPVGWPAGPDAADGPGAHSAASSLQELQASLQRVLHTGRADVMAPLQRRVPRAAAEGGGFELRHWRCTHVPVPDAAGRVAWVIHHLEDVTGLVQQQAANQALAERNTQLADASRQKSEFMSGMSHELRTPLNAIIGFSEMLKEGLAGALSPQQKEYASHIFDAGEHLLALINDLLDLAKIEAGRVDMDIAAVDLDALLHDSLTIVQDKARAQHLRLWLELHEPLGPVGADARRLRQILYNLLSNAAKFTPPGGEILLQARCVGRSAAERALPGFAAGRRLPLPDSAFDQFIEISVTDSGPGMEAADLDKLFMPFMQVGQAARRSEGTGLGLAMVHRLARLHEGAVAVTAQPGRGSCFTVWLPRRPPPCEPVPSGVVPVPVPSACTALLVEDDDQAAALMTAQLHHVGFATRRARSAEEALAMAGEPGFVPALITLDVVLPGMDGWELMTQLKGLPRWRDVPLVVVSVEAHHGLGFSLGASLVLQKPVARDELVRGLERLGFSQQRAADTTVLVVDDDAIAVEIIASHLHQSGYGVLRAFGGQEGIELATRHHPDLIALDLEMPGVSGFDVVQALKADPSTAGIPITVVTARELSHEDRRQLSGYISAIHSKKGFAESHFLEEVQRAMRRRTEH
jgi:signal transduction histidine kinase/CheY-like chemotaxis protein